MIQTCSYCGKSFTSYYVAKIPYCSKGCKKESTRRICEECGKVYYPRQQRANTRFCSRECLDIYRHRKSIETRTRICETCGKEFIMHSISGKGNKGEVNEGRFCSYECVGVWRHSQRKVFPSCEVHFIKCGICDKLFLSRRGHKRCSKECDRKYWLKYGRLNYRENAGQICKQRIERYKQDWVQPDPFRCKQCGRLFQPEYGDTSTVYCSETCRVRASRSMRRYSNNEYSRRIAKSCGERFDAVDVLKRDGWRCQLCGKKLSPKHRGTYRDDAPELDHIIPLAAGGEHSKRNTQCACRRCNLSKGSDVRGQLRLFG